MKNPTHERALVSSAASIVDSLQERPNTFAMGASSLTEDGAVTSCSTFLGRILQQVFNQAPHTIPRARRWIDHLEPVLWKDVREGHIGVIQYDEDREKMSGHCFILMYRSSSGPREYALEVVDSCRTSHGSDDSRFVDGLGIGGVGRGIIMVAAGELADQVDSYRWSPSISSETMLQGRGQRLVFGRVPRNWTLKESRNG